MTSAIEIKRHRLANGLRMLHVLNSDTKMVTLNLLYDVGSRDESEQCTGLAHLFEHLMFGGSENVPGYDEALQRAGGTSNAWTSSDFTNYYDVIPAHNAATAFRIESDRLNALRIEEDTVAVQKRVVIEEFKQTCLNRPYGDLWHVIRDTMYTVHPYKWPTIGLTPDHVANASLEDIRQFFFDHYSPSNLVMCVAGNISFADAVSLTEEWFSDIPARQVKQCILPQEPALTSPRERIEHRDVPFDLVTKVWHICGRNERDFHSFDILSDVLSNGRSARFVKNVLERSNRFSSLDAFVLDGEDCGLFVVNGALAPGASVSKAISEIDTEMNRLCDGGVTQYELEKYANKFEANYTMENFDYRSLASNLCRFGMVGDAMNAFEEPSHYRKLTVDGVNEVARRMLCAEKSATIIYGK